MDGGNFTAVIEILNLVALALDTFDAYKPTHKLLCRTPIFNFSVFYVHLDNQGMLKLILKPCKYFARPELM